MNRKYITGLAVAATLLVSLCLVGSGNARKKEISSTSRFFIDGKSFIPDESVSCNGPELEKELDKLGVRLPDGFHMPEESSPSHPALAGRLKDSRQRYGESFRLPAGLTAEHTLWMEGEEASVDLVFGKMVTRGPSIRSSLLSSGWESVSTGEFPGGIRVLQHSHGKESTIVCLDEAEDAFLLFRKVAR
ncbi:MAG: hypothetical protein PHP88_10205 [bacterium]|nr:hypothetical protein [bacterium]